MIEDPLDLESPDKFDTSLFIHYKISKPAPKKKVGALDKLISLKKVGIDQYMQPRPKSPEESPTDQVQAITQPLQSILRSETKTRAVKNEMDTVDLEIGFDFISGNAVKESSDELEVLDVAPKDNKKQ